MEKISGTDHVKNEEVLQRVEEAINRRKANWTGRWKWQEDEEEDVSKTR
jgi:hypothetical protein